MIGKTETTTSRTSAQSHIEDLDVGLMKHKTILNRIDRWCRTLNWCNGWHYDLDIIWTITQLQERNIKPGATILDAGAGLGIMQFVLASMGYNVISLDYGERDFPKYAKNIFLLSKSTVATEILESTYGNFMQFNRKKQENQKNVSRRIIRYLRYFKSPRAFLWRAEIWVKTQFNFSYYFERMRDHRKFGSIEFIRASFNCIPLGDRCVDAVVSISAFEHNEYDQMPTAAKEFVRVCRGGGPVLVTTSRSSEKDWFFEPCQGWNLTAESLAKWFGVKDIRCRDFSNALADIRGSSQLAGRIGKFYKLNGNNGLPYGNLSNAQYTPIGVCVTKQ